jgi:hypothetical protein
MCPPCRFNGSAQHLLAVYSHESQNLKSFAGVGSGAGQRCPDWVSLERSVLLWILQQNNVPGDLIKKWVGHTNLKTTSRYSYFPSDYRKEMVAKLGKVD